MSTVANSRFRVFGRIAAGLAALMVLGACSNGAFGAGGLGDLSPPPAGGEDLVEVRVQLPPTGENARSVSANMAKLYYVDYQEVIFKDRESDPPEYYIGTAKMGAEYLTISVPANKSYDILYLGGWYKNRTLLATAFTNTNDAAVDMDDNDPETLDGYADTGEGIKIEAGKANVITLHVTPVVLVLDGDDDDGDGDDDTPNVFFTWGDGDGGDKIKTITRTLDEKIATLTLDKGITGPLEIKIKTEKFKDLIHAEGGQKLTFSQNEMVLTPLQDPFDPILLSLTLPDPADDTITYTYTFTANNNPDGSGLPPELQSNDIDAGLRYNFQYYGFGTSDSKSSKWNIRNGINHHVLDTNGEGGMIRLRIGAGSTVEYDVELEFHD